MRNALLLLLFSAIILLSLSCKKDLSCESCLAKNKAPVAVAGTDRSIQLPLDSIRLDGSLSADPDGTIRSWRWTKIAGPATGIIAKPSDSVTIARNLVSGVYRFELNVTDNGGASAADTVYITVQESLVVQRPPVAHAGNDTTIILPASAAILDGSLSTDPDNNIIGYQWSRISGPGVAAILSANTVRTQANNLVAGIYLFELLVTDATGLTDRDTMKVTVEQIIQAPPCTDCRIVFVSDRDGNDEIYTCRVDGSDIRRLTNDPGADSEPVWSPGGSKIAFMSNRTGYQELYIMNADGSGLERKTYNGIKSAWSPSWSPDGRQIAFSARNNGNLNIWIIDASVPGAVPILLKDIPGWQSNPSWSPDGRSITFTGDQNAYDFVYDIWRINADGTNLVSLTNNIFDGIDYVLSRWSPDAVKLAVVYFDPSGNSHVATMSPDGTAINTITSDAYAWTRLSWAPDASRILYTIPNGTGKSIAWVSYDGSNKGILVSNGWDADWMH